MADTFALVTLYFKTAWKRYSENPLMLANLQSGTPSRNGLAALPGSTPQEKIDYALDYMEAAAALGASAFDVTIHDPNLMKSHPVAEPGAPKLRDPRRAARLAFPNGGHLYTIQRTLDNETAYDPDWDFYKAPQYANFWSRYGMEV